MYNLQILHDEKNDEMAGYFNRETTPKVLITMSPYAKVVSDLRGFFRIKWVEYLWNKTIICRIHGNFVTNYKSVYQMRKYFHAKELQ